LFAVSGILDYAGKNNLRWCFLCCNFDFRAKKIRFELQLRSADVVVPGNLGQQKNFIHPN